MHIKPFFFGDSEEQLFGIQTLPDDSKAGSWGVLICYPLGQEYLRSYQAMQRLSIELAKNGVYVMRFDYYGTGDSAGDSGFANPNRCLKDIAIAITEFRDTCRIDNLALIGLRMGATLASHVQSIDNTDRLILLDPVISGSEYLVSLETMHEHLVLDHDRYQAPRLEFKGSSAHEILGFRRAENSAESFAQFDLNELNITGHQEIALLVSGKNKTAKDLTRRWQESGVNVHYQLVESDGNWNSGDLIEEPLVYWPLIRRSVEFFL